MDAERNVVSNKQSKLEKFRSRISKANCLSFHSISRAAMDVFCWENAILYKSYQMWPKNVLRIRSSLSRVTFQNLFMHLYIETTSSPDSEVGPTYLFVFTSRVSSFSILSIVFVPQSPSDKDEIWFVATEKKCACIRHGLTHFSILEIVPIQELFKVFISTLLAALYYNTACKVGLKTFVFLSSERFLLK